jgi:hypothetical protein
VSQIIANSAPIALNLGIGQNLNALAIGDCLPMRGNPYVVPLIIKWSDYGASSAQAITVDVDLLSLGAAQQIDFIRSIYIDNTFSPTTVYAYFPDTGFTIVAPPYSVVLSPVWTNGKKVKLYATDFTDQDIPVTTYEFSNIHVNALASVVSNPVSAKKILKPNSLGFNYGGDQTTTSASYTFLNQILEAPAPSRIVFAAVFYLCTASTGVASLTVAGLPASLIGSINNNAGTFGVSLWAIALPTGLTSTIIATMSAITATRIRIKTASVYNLKNIVPYDLLVINSGAAQINTPVNGFAFAFGNDSLPLSPSPFFSIDNFIRGNVGGLQEFEGSQQTNGEIIKAINLASNSAPVVMASFK